MGCVLHISGVSILTIEGQDLVLAAGTLSLTPHPRATECKCLLPSSRGPVPCVLSPMPCSGEEQGYKGTRGQMRPRLQPGEKSPQFDSVGAAGHGEQGKIESAPGCHPVFRADKCM